MKQVLLYDLSDKFLKRLFLREELLVKTSVAPLGTIIIHDADHTLEIDFAKPVNVMRASSRAAIRLSAEITKRKFRFTGLGPHGEYFYKEIKK